MKPLITSPGSNIFCVPTALALLMEIPVDEAVHSLKAVGMGDVEIQGVYYPFLIKVLEYNGYTCKRLDDRLNWRKLPFGPKFLVVVPGHVLVVENGMAYDNAYPNGCEIKKYKRQAKYIVKFEIWKELAK